MSVIDLSSDLDEWNEATRPQDDEFLVLDDDFGSGEDDLQAWRGNIAKKRRLNPIEDSISSPVGLHEGARSHVNPELEANLEKSLTGASSSTAFNFSVHNSFTASHRTKPSLDSMSLSSGSDDSFPDDILKPVQGRQKRSRYLSERTTALLARLDEPKKQKNHKAKHQSYDDINASGGSQPLRSLEDNETGSEKAEITSHAKVPKKTKLNSEEKARAREERENIKAANRARKEEEKEKEKERKLQIKELKAKEKQVAAALAEVNKSKMDKNVTAKEMIVDIPSTIDGQNVDLQIRHFFKNLEIDATSYQAPLPNVIKWRRKVKARFNQEKDYWEPVNPMEIEDEKHIICLMSAQEFVDMVSPDACKINSLDLEGHVLRLKNKFSGSKPIYLIEGLNAWTRKNKNTLNQAYQAAVLSQVDYQGDSSEKSKPISRRKRPAHKHVDEDAIEDALLRLQVVHSCLVHHTATTAETAEWVAIFTQHISTIPTKTERMNLDTSFCMESGQVKTGDSVPDTYVRMLQEVVRVTPPIAYGIAAEYPSVVALINGFRLRGPSALTDIAKCANKNGARTEARVGPAISRRLYKVFTELDPASTDI